MVSLLISMRCVYFICLILLLCLWIVLFSLIFYIFEFFVFGWDFNGILCVCILVIYVEWMYVYKENNLMIVLWKIIRYEIGNLLLCEEIYRKNLRRVGIDYILYKNCIFGM